MRLFLLVDPLPFYLHTGSHVWRITQSLGWLPPNGSTYSQDDPPKKLKQTTNPPSRDQTFYHLDHLLPSHLKYPLHSLLVRHGRGCVRCAANGVTTQDFVDECPIDHLVRRKKGKYTSPTKKRQAVKTEEGGETVGHVVASALAGKEEEDKEAQFEPLEDAPEERKAEIEASLGSKKRRAVKLEDEAGQPQPAPSEQEGSPSPSPSPSPLKRSRISKKPKQEQQSGPTRRSSRRASATAASNAIKEEAAQDDSDLTELEDDDEDEVVSAPTRASSQLKRRATTTASTASTMKSSKPVATRTAAAGATKKKAAGGGGAKRSDGVASVSRDEAEMGGQIYTSTMHGMDV